MINTNDSRLPYLALIVGMFAISTSAILIRWTSNETEPLVIGSYRQTFETLLFVPFLIKDNSCLENLYEIIGSLKNGIFKFIAPPE